jgi:2-polyprenyl-3-methyl-5-hydroxy-6-metoxy-1,4-benzoquinol methylase
MDAARFFTWLSRTDFYTAAHAEAVALVPPGGRTWVDVGCGPGLLALLAARRGFEARGYDLSPSMVGAARREAAALGVSAAFEVAALRDLASIGPLADVVSAASLITVLPRRQEALAMLWRIVRPGGALLVVETMPRMRPVNTLRHLAGRGAIGLLLWGLARNGRSAAADIESFLPRDLAARSFHPLLGGLIGAWLFRRAPIALGDVTTQ